MIAENGELNPSYLGTTKQEASKNLGEMMVPYLNVQKNCKQESGLDCFSTQNGGMYKLFNGTSFTNWNNATTDYKIRLSDGTSLAIYGYGTVKEAGDTEALQNILGYIYVDVNGDKGPNTAGKDLFSFWISKYGIFPIGLKDSGEALLNDCRNRGIYCTAWVITKGNMDYLRKDVSW